MLKKSEVEKFLEDHKKISKATRDKLLSAINLQKEDHREQNPKYVRDSSRKSKPLSSIKDIQNYPLESILRTPSGLYRRGKTILIPVKLLS